MKKGEKMEHKMRKTFSHDFIFSLFSYTIFPFFIVAVIYFFHLKLRIYGWMMDDDDMKKRYDYI